MHGKKTFAAGDAVIVLDDDVHVGSWHLGVVKQGIVLTAKVRTAKESLIQVCDAQFS